MAGYFIACNHRPLSFSIKKKIVNSTLNMFSILYKYSPRTRTKHVVVLKCPQKNIIKTDNNRGGIYTYIHTHIYVCVCMYKKIYLYITYTVHE